MKMGQRVVPCGSPVEAFCLQFVVYRRVTFFGLFEQNHNTQKTRTGLRKLTTTIATNAVGSPSPVLRTKAEH